MALIDNETSAARLARAIVFDLTKYNADALAAGTDMSPHVEEGRVLFEGRVTRDLRMIYEVAIAASAFAPYALDRAALDARPTIEVTSRATPRPSTRIVSFIVAASVWVSIGLLLHHCAGPVG